MEAKIIATLAIVVLVCSMLIGCRGSNSTLSKKSNPIVTLKIKGRGDIKIELYPDIAPNTVNNFIYLVQDGFYDGLTFHRIIQGFVIQGGDPEGTGIGGPGYGIKGEFKSNGFEGNDLKHKEGVLSMARAAHPDSAGSQFFIMLGDSPHLDGDYAAFGEVIEGMDVVEKIASVNVDSQGFPAEEQVIEKATVELFGKEYDEPEKIK